MKILEYDRNLAVCIKPVGVSSEDEPNGMPEQLRQALGGEIFPIHRLDLNVGGLMVYARNRKAAAAMSCAVAEGRIIKEYLAVLEGIPDQPAGILEDFLWKDSHKNKVYAVKKERRGVKKAKLSYELLESGTHSLVWVRLYTGRSHQIRVQFSSRGWPLAGDHKYGSRAKETAPALWSAALTFPHPATGERKHYVSLPEGEIWDPFSDVLERQRGRLPEDMKI